MTNKPLRIYSLLAFIVFQMETTLHISFRKGVTANENKEVSSINISIRLKSTHIEVDQNASVDLTQHDYIEGSTTDVFQSFIQESLENTCLLWELSSPTGDLSFVGESTGNPMID